MKLDWLTPPGLRLKREALGVGLGLGAAALYSFRFLIEYHSARRLLYGDRLGTLYLLPGAVLPPFPRLLAPALGGFAAYGLCMGALAGFHYLYHRLGSRSDYLMRRLPNPRERHLRCLALPALGLLAGLVTLGLLSLLYYGVYLTRTPPGCLPSSLWA